MSSFVFIQLIFAKCLNQTDDTCQVNINTVVKNVIYNVAFECHANNIEVITITITH